MTQIGRTVLPVAVRDLAARLSATPGPPHSIVTLTQAGRMKRELNSKSWMSFRATQTIATDACGFAWNARFGPLGIVAVSDILDGGVGRLAVRALGVIPIASLAPSPELTRGELMRYLGEIAFAPDIILANPALRWQADGPDRLVVAAGSGAIAAEVTLALDNDGRIGSFFSPVRPRSTGETFVATPWSGRFSDYRQHLGRWLPFAADVAWDIDGIRNVYLEARIESWATTPE